MSFTIPDEVLHSTGMSEVEMRREIAVMLYQTEKLTLAQAARRGTCPGSVSTTSSPAAT